MMEVELLCGDCLVEMKNIPDESIDLVLTDPPYGTTSCKWDTIIPFEPMWEQLRRVTRKSGAIVLFGSQPFTSALVMSNPKMFKYEWIWETHKGKNPMLAKVQPMKIHENILVFGSGKLAYYPQMSSGEPYKKRGAHNKLKKHNMFASGKSVGYAEGFDSSKRYPTSKLYFANHNQKKNSFHPTQKPVDLMEYLIKTYTTENVTVLDFAMGSGSTGVACRNINRKFVGIEIDESYFNVSKRRIYNVGT